MSLRLAMRSSRSRDVHSLCTCAFPSHLTRYSACRPGPAATRWALLMPGAELSECPDRSSSPSWEEAALSFNSDYNVKMEELPDRHSRRTHQVDELPTLARVVGSIDVTRRRRKQRLHSIRLVLVHGFGSISSRRLLLACSLCWSRCLALRGGKAGDGAGGRRHGSGDVLGVWHHRCCAAGRRRRSLSATYRLQPLAAVRGVLLGGRPDVHSKVTLLHRVELKLTQAPGRATAHFLQEAAPAGSRSNGCCEACEL